MIEKVKLRQMRHLSYLILMSGILFSCGKGTTDVADPGSYLHMTFMNDTLNLGPVEIFSASSIYTFDDNGKFLAFDYGPLLPPKGKSYHRVLITTRVGGTINPQTGHHCILCSQEDTEVLVTYVRPNAENIIYRGNNANSEVCLNHNSLQFLEESVIPILYTASGSIRGQLVSDDGTSVLNIQEAIFNFKAY